MPNAIRGNVYDYNYGPIVGSELSGHRCALIISRDEANIDLHVAISLPTSERAPSSRQYRNHVEIAGAGSWASVRQIKFIDQECLKRLRGSATPRELERALDIIRSRLDGLQCIPGTVTTELGPMQIDKGTVWNVQFDDDDNNTVEVPVVVLDYNDGNKMAITAEVEFNQRTGSPVRIPIVVTDEGGAETPSSALIHRIRSIDVSERTMEKIGVVDQSGISVVNADFLRILDPQQEWPPPTDE